MAIRSKTTRSPVVKQERKVDPVKRKSSTSTQPTLRAMSGNNAQQGGEKRNDKSLGRSSSSYASSVEPRPGPGSRTSDELGSFGQAAASRQNTDLKYDSLPLKLRFPGSEGSRVHPEDGDSVRGANSEPIPKASSKKSR